MTAAAAPAGTALFSRPDPRCRPARTRLATARLAAALIGMAVLLAGCGSGDSAGGSAAGSAASEADGAVGAQAAGPQAAADKAAADPARGAVGSAAAASAAGPRLVRTAEVAFEVKDLAAAAGRVRAVAPRFGGFVASETTGLNEPVQTGEGDSRAVAPQGQGTLVLRVVEAKLDAAVDDVAQQARGKELSRSSSSADVTGDLADLQSRVATQRASVVRVRQLLDKAVSLQDVVLLEAEVSKRESELEALQARLAALGDQADLATLTVVLRTPDAETAPEPDRNGFLIGLDNGWSAVKASTTIVLTLLGALLPVALVGGLLVWPGLVLQRRRRARRPAPATPVRMAAPPVPEYAGAPAPAPSPGPEQEPQS